MDAEFDLGIIQILKKEFNVTTTPTIIINEKEKLEGLTPKKKIVEALVKAHEIRPERYTILGETGLTEDAAKKVAKITGVI